MIQVSVRMSPFGGIVEITVSSDNVQETIDACVKLQKELTGAEAVKKSGG